MFSDAGPNTAFIGARASEADRIRPFENSRFVSNMPGPQPPSFVSTGTLPAFGAPSSADAVHDEAADRYAQGDYDQAEGLYIKVTRIHIFTKCSINA